MTARIRVVVVAPGKPSATVVVPNTLASFRHFVGGYLEIYAPAALRERGMYGYINEDGHRLELTPNFPGVNGPVLGTIVVSAADAAGDEVGLDDVQAAFAARYFDTLRRLPSESERPRQHPEGPCGISDDNLRAIFVRILDEDPECPLKPGARQYGSDDPAVVWVMAGFLLSTVYKYSGEIIATERARRIVTDEFTARRLKRQAELS